MISQINVDEQIKALLDKVNESKGNLFRIGVTSSSYDNNTKTVKVKFNSSDPTSSVIPCKCTYSAQKGFANNGSSAGKTVFVIKVGASWVVTDLF
ncbi:hypothetical protein AR454_28660 [Bacillus mycoides]|uniref:hypothetical protein n=1 Tax=Bacillus mycoides TaxID=1405 RepID=UPI001E5A6E39|nr:hypothetical protein [Bacillus mycoides]MCD4646336.1 hypothetical protein [Bacillus mycoides]